ncbi:unnamed protein product [Penicillium pancosmium]
MGCEQQSSHLQQKGVKGLKACDACARRKIQCDKAFPKCDWCTHQGTPCTFTRNSRRQQKAYVTGNKQRAARLEARISLVESILCDKLAHNSRIGSDSSQSQVKADEELFCYPRGFLVPHDEEELPTLQHEWLNSKPTSIISEAREFVRSVLGRSVNLEALFRPSTPWKCRIPRYMSQEMPIQSFTELADVRIVNDHVAAYCSSPVRFILPIIDRTLFENTINLAFSTPLANASGVSSAKACVWAFLCLSSIWNFPVAHRLQIDATVLAMEVERYIPRILQEETIDGLQALLMLIGLYLDSLITRLIYKFGAHVQSPPGSSIAALPDTDGLSQVHHHLRSLFWTAYVIDKEVSIRMGQPAAIQDEACDLTIPPGQSAIQKPDAELFKTIRELDEELEEWRLSIPSQYRPSLSTAIGQATNASSPFMIHAINLQMDYHHCLALIHRACSRSTVWTRGGDIAFDKMATSFRLAVESSRKSLNLLRDALPTLPEGTFWSFVFHPLSACLTIFGNILLFPLSPETTRDFALLDSAASLIRALPMNSQQAYKSNLVELVTKLAERAKLATREAREDRRTLAETRWLSTAESEFLTA